MSEWSVKTEHDLGARATTVSLTGKLLVSTRDAEALEEELQARLRRHLHRAVDVAVEAVLDSGVLEAALAGAMQGARYRRALDG